MPSFIQGGPSPRKARDKARDGQVLSTMIDCVDPIAPGKWETVGLRMSGRSRLSGVSLYRCSIPTRLYSVSCLVAERRVGLIDGGTCRYPGDLVACF